MSATNTTLYYPVLKSIPGITGNPRTDVTAPRTLTSVYHLVTILNKHSSPAQVKLSNNLPRNKTGMGALA